MSSTLKDKMPSHNSFLEVMDTEKRLMALVHSKGILHGDVLELYRKVRTEYEKILLESKQMVELKEVEYLLWKLHYNQIDEYRKRIKKQSSDTENRHVKGFSLFLSEGTEFYRDLIVKLRRSCGLPEEVILEHKDGSSFSAGYNCQFTCHRLLVCLGDFARYLESLEKYDARDWSVAASYYLEAIKTWPDSGYPHNQLALLATYVGDSFLALYHSLRSLSVKEPFPDAWRNIIFLFEENRSVQLQVFTSDVELDLLNLSIISSLSETKNNSPEKIDLWSVVIRTMSFFVLKSSLEEFPNTLASTFIKLESILSLDDKELSATMESYQFINSSQTGPYRAIQLVSIFIFVLHSLIDKKTEKCEYTQLAFVAVFTCMGRIANRCLRGTNRNCPLLPAVLVFVEWLANNLDLAQENAADKRAMNAMSYFFDALSGFLNKVDKNNYENNYGFSPDYTALWEDYELKGYYPLNQAQEMLDFSVKHKDDCDKSRRFQRVYHAATRILDKSRYSFPEVQEQKNFPPEIPTSKATEDEEIIVFKPISRRNSAPINSVSLLPNESLHRATSSSICEQEAVIDSFSFCSISSSSGPPSLNAWVPGGREKTTKSFDKHKLTSIKEIPFTPFSRSPYVAPIPSAPLLPDDADWNDVDRVGLTPGLIDGYPLFLGMSSSEWLYHYRKSQNLNPMVYFGGPQIYSNPSLVCGSNEQTMWDEKQFPYMFGVRKELRSEQPLVLQYLKEKKWQVQPDL